MNFEKRVCQNCKASFEIDASDFDFYEKMKVPPPTWCPKCRMIRRMAWRNERRLFRRKDAKTGRDLLSLYPAESEWPVYHDSDWWNTDVWDALEYGRDFDPNKPFLAQLFDLCKQVPKCNADATRMVNSEYSGNAADMKNCYLVFNATYDEDCGYGNGFTSCKNCYEGSYLHECERCYGSFWLNRCYETHFSSYCDDCISVWFSKDCRGCNNCFGCCNLRRKSYCIFNQQYTKEEYQAKLKELNLSSWKNLVSISKKAKDFWLKRPNKDIQGAQNLNVSGAYIANSKNVKESYLIRGGLDIAYVQYGQYPKLCDLMDVTVTGETELVYESVTCGFRSTRMKFCVECWNGSCDLEYCLFCMSNSSNLFGCVGVQKKQYCILNKQYSKEEYFVLREEIIQQMNEMPYVDEKDRVYKYGEFFPPEFSAFAYQQTILPEHFSLTKKQAEAFGCRWQDANPAEYQTTKDAKDLPDDIKDVGTEILKEIIKCEKCGRAYRIIEPELQFLKQMKIPASRWCVDCRHYERISQRNPAVYYDRKCDKCKKDIKTSYAPDSPEIIYCEQCYNTEVA